LTLSAPVDRPSVGLRERKKARTRAEIQGHALRLFHQQGYEATTVAQIIEEAEVSESTFFRYFPTKADVVLFDGMDELIVEAFRDQPHELAEIRALRVALQTVFGRLSTREAADQERRMRLIFSVRELRATLFEQLVSTMELLRQVVAERTGRQPDDLAVRSLAGAVIGVSMAVMVALGDDPTANIGVLLDEAMGHLEAGLDL
jgi:AcrR family transcriptional regulator